MGTPGFQDVGGVGSFRIIKGLILNRIASKKRLGGNFSQFTFAWKRWIGTGLSFLILMRVPKNPPPKLPMKLESMEIKAQSTGIGVSVIVGVGVIDGVSVFNYTVDKVQGREADIVFLSLVRNNNIGFMDNPNRINVAITRAKYQLVLVGNRKFLAEKGSCEEWRQISKRALPPYDTQKNRSRGKKW